MSNFHLILTILNRQYEEEYIPFLEQYGVKHIASTLARGTATNSISEMFGLEHKEKTVFQYVIASAQVEPLFYALVSRFGINMPGTGIAMSIPLESIAGASSLKYLTEGQESFSSEEVRMKEAKYSLISVIVEKGCSDMVMDAARDAGAKGGTVVHAKGTGTEQVAKFFGVSITPEKELIYIATRKSQRSEIMKAIMENAGPHTEAKAVVFSLPVEDIAGLTSVQEEE